MIKPSMRKLSQDLLPKDFRRHFYDFRYTTPKKKVRGQGSLITKIIYLLMSLMSQNLVLTRSTLDEEIVANLIGKIYYQGFQKTPYGFRIQLPRRK